MEVGLMSTWWSCRPTWAIFVRMSIWLHCRPLTDQDCPTPPRRADACSSSISLIWFLKRGPAIREWRRSPQVCIAVDWTCTVNMTGLLCRLMQHACLVINWITVNKLSRDSVKVSPIQNSRDPSAMLLGAEPFPYWTFHMRAQCKKT